MSLLKKSQILNLNLVIQDFSPSTILWMEKDKLFKYF